MTIMPTTPFPISPALRMVVDAIFMNGGRPMIVGGSVRDWLLGLEPKDIDIEVYGLEFEALEKILAHNVNWKVDAVGKSFGVLKVTVPYRNPCNCDLAGEGHRETCPTFIEKLKGFPTETFDVALPRSENKTGQGHRGFVATTDPNMSFKDAAARRDFTINAMGLDPTNMLTQVPVLVDPHRGSRDLREGVLRHVGPAFDEDPLRVLRGCQFASRFGFKMAPETVERCKTLRGELSTLPVERLWEEWKKLLVKGKKPSLGLEAMRETGALVLFPELEALIGVQQDPEWHPEGDVWVHNNMVIDSAVRVCDDDGVEGEERLIIMLGALCHDLGKPACTEFKAKENDPNGEKRWRAHDHESQGEAPTRSFLARIGAPPAIVEAVVPLVLHHLKPFHLARDKASPAAIRRLAVKAPLDRLTRVARADHLGRTTPDALACTDSRKIEDINWLMEKAATIKVADRAPTGILMGRHLIDLGLKPGPEMGKLLKAAFEAQLDGVFEDEPGAVAWAKTKLAAN